MSAIRILVVDDHALLRKMICSFLSKEPSVEVICQTASGEEAIEKAKELQPDMVVLDISLPRISGIEAAKQIIEASPLSRIIFLSQHSALHVVREAFAAGGHGYVAKSDAGFELMQAIRSVSHGNCFVSQLIRSQGWTADDGGLNPSKTIDSAIGANAPVMKRPDS